MTRPCRLRENLGKSAFATGGALGISSKSCEESGKERRTATKAPPAETFNAVANSNHSLSFPSLPRTKIGIARGRRCHFRRSGDAFLRSKVHPLLQIGIALLPHLGGQSSPPLGALTMTATRKHEVWARIRRGTQRREVFSRLFSLPCGSSRHGK